MAMLKNKNMALSLILMCLIVVSPMANAQLPEIFGSINVVVVNARVPCSVNATVSTNNATTIPPFPNATVVLQCGRQTVATGTTNTAGIVSFPTTGLLQFLISLLTNGCRVVTTTPLSSCNATLPNQVLSAPLMFVGTTFNGGVNLIELVASPFLPVLN